MIKFKRRHKDAIIPKRAEDGAAGFDLSVLGLKNEVGDDVERCMLYRGAKIIVSTGISMQIPKNCVGIIKPRSGLAIKHGVDVLAGVIDSSYRGEIKVILVNHSDNWIDLEFGMRIAQLIVTPIITDFEVVEELDETERGDGGFGSTGK